MALLRDLRFLRVLELQDLVEELARWFVPVLSGPDGVSQVWLMMEEVGRTVFGMVSVELEL